MARERAVEEALRRVGVRVSAADEHARGRLADAERLGEVPSLAGRAGGDGPLHRRATLRRAPDGTSRRDAAILARR